MTRKPLPPHLAPFDEGPADGTRLAREIYNSVPEADAEWNRAMWRRDLKHRVAARIAAQRAAVTDSPEATS